MNRSEWALVPRKATPEMLAAVKPMPRSLIDEREAEGVAGYRERMTAAVMADRAELAQRYEELIAAAPPPPAEQASGEHIGRLDPTTYEQIEAALDRAEAPSRDASGRWLPLAERVAALSQRPVVLNSPPPPAEQASGEVDARVRDGEKLLATLPQRWLIVIDRLNYMIARDASGIDVIKSARGNDEAEFLAMVIALSQQQVVDEARIERIVRAAISKHCPEGKWLTGPNTLAMSIAFRVYEALAPQQPTGEENSDAAR